MSTAHFINVDGPLKLCTVIARETSMGVQPYFGYFCSCLFVFANSKATPSSQSLSWMTGVPPLSLTESLAILKGEVNFISLFSQSQGHKLGVPDRADIRRHPQLKAMFAWLQTEL